MRVHGVYAFTAVRLASALVLACLSGTASWTGVPELLSYQGKLLDSAGQPVADGSYSMEFRFYDDCTAGNLLLTDTHAVEVRDGIYGVLLGGGTLTAGVESGVLGVFQNHPAVCLGITVGSDSEMQPRHPIVSAAYALRAASAEQVGVAPIHNGVYSCAADWNGNGTAPESADVIACLQSALAALTTNENGTDNAISVKLPDGRFDVSAACSGGTCFELKSGIHIVGEMPRVRYLEHIPPDGVMEPNGGTWLEPGVANVLFTGQHLRGVVLERFGVVNFGKLAVLGGDREDGISFSTIRDVYAVGAPRFSTPRSTDTWVLYNIQHVRMDHVKVYGVERGLYIISQNRYWQPANSVISDFYVHAWPDPPGAIRLESMEGSESPTKMLNYVSFIRPQVNAFNSTGAPGSTGIWLKGFSPDYPVQMTWLDGADVEGEYEVAIRLENAKRNHIEIAGVTTPLVGLSLDGGSSSNVISSVSDRVSVSMAPGVNNIFVGLFDALDDAMVRGLYYDRLQNRWTASLGRHGAVASGSGYLWYDDNNNRWLTKEGEPTSSADGSPIVTGTGATATSGPMLWVDQPTTCTTACLQAGMANCVEGWADGVTVGCGAIAKRRMCGCR